MNHNIKALLDLCAEMMRFGRAGKEEALKLARECLANYRNGEGVPLHKDTGRRGMFEIGDDRAIETCVDVLEVELAETK